MSKTLESGASGGEGECEGDRFHSVLFSNNYQLVLYIFCLSLENTNSLADGVNSKVILDTTGAEKLKFKGRCLISTGGEIVEGQSIYATENDVNKYVKSHLKDRSEVLIERVTNNERENKKSLERLEMDNNGGIELWV